MVIRIWLELETPVLPYNSAAFSSKYIDSWKVIFIDKKIRFVIASEHNNFQGLSVNVGLDGLN